MRNLTVVVLASVVTLGYTPEATAQQTEAEQALEVRNKEIARAFYEDLWFSRNTDRFADYVADTYVVHDIGDRKGVTEPAVEQKNIADFFWKHGDLSGEIDFQIAEGDLRDEAMAENAAWLVEHAFPAGKMVGWAHSGHIARRLAGVDVIDGSFSWAGEIPMGEHLSAQFGPRAYAIGFLAFEGEKGQVFPDTAFVTRVPEAPVGSLDWLLAQIGAPYLFIDLRSVPQDHWLRTELVARPVFVDMKAVWPDVYDGFIFTREMFPNRRLTPLGNRD